MSSDWTGLVDICAVAIGRAVKQIPGPNDAAIFRRVVNRSNRTGTDFLESAVALDVKFTPAIWAGYLGELCSHWQSMDIAPLLQPLADARRLIAESAEAESDTRAAADPRAVPGARLVDGALAILASLVRLRNAEPDAERKREFLAELFDLIQQVDANGDPDNAYDLAAVGLDLGPPDGEIVERLARYAASNGAKAGRMHQVAVSQASLAAAIAAAAEADPDRRIEAFDASERALEALAVADPKVRGPVIAQLNPLFETWGYLNCLQLPLLSYLPAEQRSSEFNQRLGTGTWPLRVATSADAEAWLKNVLQGPASAWETEIDSNRFRLEADLNRRQPTADWLSRAIGRPAFRYAVPQDRSFFREASFQDQLLELTHEVTQGFCVISQVGMALAALRIALFDNEITLWSNVPADGSDADRIAARGAAPIAPGNVVGLIRAELRLELVEKSRLLLDVWTSWFEGLAVFAECAADPKLDTHGMSLVGEALRGMVDYFPKGNLSPDEVRRGAEKQFAEFERLWHEAVRNEGPARLARHLGADEGAPVLSAYLAVRSVIATWERTLGRRMLGSEALSLLLHATRHGTEDAIPDLSIPADRFGEEVLRLHAAWIRKISSLSDSEIEEFLQPPDNDGPGRAFEWEGERLTLLSADDDSLNQREIAARSRLLEESFRSSIKGAPDIDTSHEAARAVTTEAPRVLEDGQAKKLSTGIVRDRLPLMDQFLAAASLLSIGSSAARFHLRTADGEEYSQLGFYLRTTEKLASNGEPGSDMLMWRLPAKSAVELAKQHRQLALPRLEVSRLIDLAGLVRPGSHGSCHVFALNFGGWLHIQGTAPMTEMFLREDEDRLVRLTEIIRYRLAPSPLQKAERDLIAPGRLPVERTLTWLQESEQWSFGETPVDAQSWAQGLERCCEAMLGLDRRDRQRKFAARLLGEIWADHEAAGAVAERFAALTAGSPAAGKDIVDWLYRSGRGDRTVSVTDELDGAYGNGDLPFVTRVADEWSVRPVVPSGK